MDVQSSEKLNKRMAVQLWCAAAVLGLCLVGLSMVRASGYFTAMAADQRDAYRDFGTLTERVSNGLFIAALIGLYAWWVWRHVRIAHAEGNPTSPTLLPRLIDRTRPLRALMMIAGPLLLIAWFVYPYSGDVRLYLHYGAMANAGVNPITTRADAFASPWSNTLAWGQTSTYGPLAIAIYSIPSLLAPSGATPIHSWTQTIPAMYCLKLIALLLHVATTLLVARSLAPREDRWDWALLYAINPVVLVELVANAHIDSAVVMLAALGLLAVRQNRYVTAAAALVAASLVKSVAIIWLPLLGLDMLRKRRFRAAGVAIAGAIALAVVLSLTVLPDLKAWSSLLNAGIGTKASESIASIAWRLMAETFYLREDLTNVILHTIVMGLRAVFVLLSATIAWRLWTRREWPAAGAMGLATLLLFVLACPWYRPWYATVLLLPPVFLSLGYWNRAAVLALVAGGSIGSAVLPPHMLLDLMIVVPVTACLLIGLTQELRSAVGEVSKIDLQSLRGEAVSSEPA